MTMFQNLPTVDEPARVQPYRAPKQRLVRVRTLRALCFGGAAQDVGYEVEVPELDAAEMISRGVVERVA